MGLHISKNQLRQEALQAGFHGTSEAFVQHIALILPRTAAEAKRLPGSVLSLYKADYPMII
jgi:hypothetical protein